jgi:hypothetical protein
MSSWLADIATDNVEYVTYLLGKLGEIVELIIDAVGAVINSAGVLVIWEVARLVGKAVSMAIDELGAIANNIASMVDRIIEADRVLADFSYFHAGSWPEAVTRA